jgi:pimeloyl-ACP methyl ester carboxylesterase
MLKRCILGPLPASPSSPPCGPPCWVQQCGQRWQWFTGDARDSVLPGLRTFDQEAIERISENYALSVAPEAGSPKVQGPTVFIMGRQDHVVGFQDQTALSSHYLQSTITVLDRAGHNAHLDQQGITSALLEEWLIRMQDWKQDGLSSLDPRLPVA